MIPRALRHFAGAILLVGLAGCGSGGAGIGLASGIGSGGTGIVAGTVTGFGSIIVDGSRYPDTGAAYDLTGDSSGAVAVSPTAAAIGQQVEAEIDSGGNATAVHIYPAVIGLVSAVSASTDTITVAGMRVVANATNSALPITVYAGYAQFSDIHAKDRVEVYGLSEADSSGPYLAASRIELKPSSCTNVCGVRVTGILGQLDTTNQTFTLGALTVSYSGSTVITPVGLSLANGERVSVYSSTPLIGTSLDATAIAIRAMTTATGYLRLSGAISDYASNASFSVSGVAVNAGSATLTRGSLVLANGVTVVVVGSFDPGTNQLVATSVTGYSSDSNQAELHGTITNFVSVANFQVRGTLVDASAATYSGGTAADLQNNTYVEIRGTVSNNVVSASTVAFTSETDGSVDDLTGVISGYTYPTQPFSIALDNRGTTVQAILAAAPFYIGGTSADMSDGKYVTVDASLVNGQWVVNTVTFMLGTPPAGDGSPASGGSTEIEGIAGNVNLGARTFSLNGVTVNFSGITPTGGGTLANGISVQVYGTFSGSTLSASGVKIEQDQEQN
jgi:Domain of unknown function (DUF5666)